MSYLCILSTFANSLLRKFYLNCVLSLMGMSIFFYGHTNLHLRETNCQEVL